MPRDDTPLLPGAAAVGAVCRRLGLDPDEVRNTERHGRTAAIARQAVVTALRAEAGYSLERVARAVGYRTRWGVIYAWRRGARRFVEDLDFADLVWTARIAIERARRESRP